MMIEQCDLSERRACRLVGLSRNSYRHPPEVDQMTKDLSGKNVESVGRRFGEMLKKPAAASAWSCSGLIKSTTSLRRASMRSAGALHQSGVSAAWATMGAHTSAVAWL
ncbi:MAG: hypothetical protein Q7K57_00955 [Burkholderiaceae bacterium]|nr:hypothetical protein [Burkholderiaceae bacterium]